MKKVKVFLGVLGFMLMSAAASFAGNVHGTVQFSGTAPERKPLEMGADPTCMAAHSEPVRSEEVVVNGNGTLRNVFIYVKEGLEGQTFEVPKESVTMDQHGCQYTPHVFGVQVGQNVEIINSDPTLHNVHGMPHNSKEFNLGMPIQGMKLKRKFNAPEIGVAFKCDVHPWMRAYAGVVENPYFGVTGEDGSYTIKDLPAGSYVLEAWHEKYGTQTMNLEVAAGDTQADFTFSA